MSNIKRFLDIGAVLMHEDKDSSRLDYLSRVDGEQATWYYWLTGIPGVYELKLTQESTVDNLEKSSFSLKYYPDIEEDNFERYSFKEQVLRMSDYFENEDIHISDNIELCPCCGGNILFGQQHVCKKKIHKRSKGIPNLSKRKFLPKRLFEVSKLEFVTTDRILKMYVKTMNVFRTYATDGVNIRTQDGTNEEIIPCGGMDRNVPGMQITEPFLDFINSEFMQKFELECKNKIVAQQSGTVMFYDKDEKESWEEQEDVYYINIKYEYERRNSDERQN